VRGQLAHSDAVRFVVVERWQVLGRCVVEREADWMLDASDMELLRDYARRNSEPAFETLVSRHINLVYSVALRSVGNPEQAEEITQAVFIILARKAARLHKNTSLSGWM
jgi:hypothetical protein